jgi:hypothetical protein
MVTVAIWFVTPQIYAGYVDDPRNTDNAWTETVVLNFHDEAGKPYSPVHITPALYSHNGNGVIKSKLLQQLPVHHLQTLEFLRRYSHPGTCMCMCVV